MKKLLTQSLLGAGIALAAGASQAADLTITFHNLAPAGGVGVAPLWVGLHDGGFDSFNEGAAASLSIERAAEDGNAGVLSTLFSTSSSGTQGLLPGGPAFPGATRTLTLHNVDLQQANRYFSFAAMVVLSNDFFVGNDLAKQYDLSSLAKGGSMSISLGAGSVYDAGTEVNDFRDSLANGAFGIGGGQTHANQGVDEHGVVHRVTGNPYTSFLGQELVPAGRQWGALDFNAGGEFGRIDISVSAVPEPASYAMFGLGLGLIGLLQARRRRATA